MTRINIGISPSILRDKHLLAEHREIIRLPNNVKSGKAIVRNLPPKFTMGTGHVKFFYNKLGYIKRRYHEIYNECRKRGFNVQYYGEAFKDIPANLMQDYQPTAEDMVLITQRLKEKSAFKE